MKARLLRIWVYFHRGHGVWLAFILSFLNFIAIQYTQIIERVPFLKMIFPQLTVFFLLFVLVYGPLAILIGWYDYRRGSIPTSSRLSAKASPFYRDVAKALILLSEDTVSKEKVRELMRKWTEEL